MAAQPLLGCGNDRPDDPDEHPAVFYIESTSQDHQKLLIYLRARNLAMVGSRESNLHADMLLWC